MPEICQDLGHAVAADSHFLKCMKIKPNFAVVGAAKAGTSSLYSWLKQHPDVYVPNVKEPSYFVNGYGFTDWDGYIALFKAV